MVKGKKFYEMLVLPHGMCRLACKQACEAGRDGAALVVSRFTSQGWPSAKARGPRMSRRQRGADCIRLYRLAAQMFASVYCKHVSR